MDETIRTRPRGRARPAPPELGGLPPAEVPPAPARLDAPLDAIANAPFGAFAKLAGLVGVPGALTFLMLNWILTELTGRLDRLIASQEALTRAVEQLAVVVGQAAR